jgi:hypothetical protein
MLVAHWLERAIKELYAIPNTKERRRELKHRLIDVQADILDELQRHSHSFDISNLVETTRGSFEGLSLAVALGHFALVATPPASSALAAEAREALEEFPLQSLFEGRVMDSSGKTVHRVPGLGTDDGQGALLARIAEHDKHRRSVEVAGGIETARRVIMYEHYVTEQDMDYYVAIVLLYPTIVGIFRRWSSEFLSGRYAGSTTLTRSAT